MLYESARRRPGIPALWRWVDVRFEPITYAELIGAATAIANRLATLGIKPEERVAIAVTDRFSWSVTYIGVLFSGATAVPIDPLLTPPEIKGILHDADALREGDAALGDELLGERGVLRLGSCGAHVSVPFRDKALPPRSPSRAAGSGPARR